MGRLIIIFLGVLIFVIGCNNNSNRQDIAEKKKTGNHKMHTGPSDTDSIIYDSCYEKFFKDLPRFADSTSAYLIMDEGKRKSLTQFFTDEFMSPRSHYGKKDLNVDGKAELVIFNNTGGAHCCDEYYIFSQKNDRDFEYKAHLMGQICIDASTNTFTYSFSETFGYFFSCYACGFSTGDSPFKPMRDIQLKYTNSKLEVVHYDTSKAKQNLANLEVLRKHGFEKIDGLMDSGWRKEFAINFAIWHYNHGKLWRNTKKLFDHYYIFKDATKVWKEFHHTIIEIQKENSF